MSIDDKKRIVLISVSDKRNIDKIAKKLINNNYQILSTGGTAKFLTDNNIDNISISKFTNFDEILGGRVKTLHPLIHAGILAKNKKDLSGLNDKSYKMIDMVIVNLYPFESVISKKDTTFQNAIENIDIGGPTMLRAAAKNFSRVTVVTDPNDYEKVINEIEKLGVVSDNTRYELARKVFEQTSLYDSLISNYLSNKSKNKKNTFPDKLQLILEKKQELRYGENPHQSGKLYSIKNKEYVGFDFNQIFGKELSYNNLVDAESAFSCVQQFDKPTCVIVKHANPCGVAECNELEKAYKKAFLTDPISAFGGVIAFNREVNNKLLNKIINNQFVEVIIAPKFAKNYINIIEKKPNVRLISVKDGKNQKYFDMKSLKSNFLIQETDVKKITKKDLKVVTNKKPSTEQINDLLFAFRVARFVKSNAIVLAKDMRTLGIGAGQMSRIDSTNIAKNKAKTHKINLKNCVMASEAFFPFRDNVDLAKKIGVSSILQPGGSIKDQEIIDVANTHGISMVFSGIRVFKH